VRHRQLAWLTPVIVLSLHLSGVAAGDSPTKDKKTAAAVRPLTWPLPPEQPRIRYVTSYHGADDFKTKKSGRWKSLLLGQDPAAGIASDTLVKPYAIAVGPTGRVYVTDTAVRRVFVFDPDARTLSFVGDSGTGKLTKPTGVAVDEDGRVFVADATLNRVFGYAPDGRVVIAIGKEGELKTPSGLAIDPARKYLYVADTAAHQVLCYSTADGSLVRAIGKRGGDAGEFNFLTNLSVDRQGRLYVSDTMNFRIQIFDAGGKALGAFGTQGDTPGSFNRAKGVAVDSEGHIYVTDTSFNNFQVFDAERRLLLYVGAAGREPGEFYLPAGMYIDRRDEIYVADQGNSRVQVFQYLRGGAK
jgi:DNA-binding beta-propeller fold protein YncE